MRFTYHKFANDVPRSITSMSDECVPFNVSIPITPDWKDSKMRVLLVCQYVATDDLKCGRLLGGQSGTALSNVINFAENTVLRNWYKKPRSPYALAAINFNFFKTFHLNKEQQRKADAIATRRVVEYIERIKPTHVFIAGDQATRCLLQSQNIPAILEKRGWVFNNVPFGSVKATVAYCVDFSESVSTRKVKDSDEDENEFDNEKLLAPSYLLGFFSRCWANMMAKGSPYSIADVAPNPIAITDIHKFRKMMKLLHSKKRVAFDTETSGFESVVGSCRITVKLEVIQFAVDSKRAFIVPYHHKDSPFTKDELEEIRTSLRDFFMLRPPEFSETDPYYLTGFNLKYDLTVIRQVFGIPVVHWPIFDTRSGEYLFDETLKFLVDYETPAGNLAYLCVQYGNDFYRRATFSKDERGSIAYMPFLDPGVQAYCAMDVQTTLAIAEVMQQRAKDIVHKIGDRFVSYYPDYMRMQLLQMNNNIHVFSVMEHRGVHIDRPYLMYLKSNNSPINKMIWEAKSKFKSLPSCKAANAILLQEAGIPAKGLYGVAQFMFDIDKPAHRELLFFRVLKLKPTVFSKKTGKPSIGKLFKEAYKDVEEVALLNELDKLKKLKSSYIDSFAKVLTEGEGRIDSRIRPNYDFYPVLTGRSNSSEPSLQQIPQHGDKAKYIKRMFSAKKGCILIKQDYSAHEVRGWSIISGDKVLAAVFEVGRRLRKLYHKTGAEDLRVEIDSKGDIHRLNAEFFFSVAISAVTKELRQAVKAVAFGAIYGKSWRTLAKELKRTEEFTKDLYARFFKRFPRASAWLEWAKSFGQKNYFVHSCIGRRRHLWSYMTGVPKHEGDMNRRGMNAPIQGLGADLGHTGSRIFMKEAENYFLESGVITEDSSDMPCNVEVMVHDSTRTESPLEHVLPMAHILQWSFTRGVVDYYTKWFGLNFTVYPEVEMEFGVDESRMYKWNWSMSAPEREKDEAFSLKVLMAKVAKDYVELYGGTEKDFLTKVFAPYKNKELRNWLNEAYAIIPD